MGIKWRKIQSTVLSLAIAFSAFSGLSAYAQTTGQEDGLTLHYSFDGALNATDSSGSGKDGKIFGTVETSENGVFGDALRLKGGYVHMPKDIVYGYTNLTVSIWINPQAATPNQLAWSIGSNAENFINLFAPLNSNGLYHASALRVNNNAARIQASSATFQMGTWKHLVVSYTEANNGMLKIYENGTLLGQGATNKKVADLGYVTNALIGRSQFAVDPDFNGYIDDFRIYNRELTQTEIADMTQEGLQSLVNQTATSLDLAKFNGLTSLTGVTDDLALMQNSDIVASGANITWASSTPAVISTSGKVSTVTQATNVTLTATVERAQKTATKEFNVTVEPKGAVTVDPVADITTVIGKKPTLPQKITANGGKRSMTVQWNSVSPDSYAFAGEFVATGKLTENNASVSVKVKVTSSAIANPIIIPGSAGGSPDPFIVYQYGWYYYCRHDFNTGVTVSKAKRTQDIEAAPRVTVYTAPETGMYSKEYWAPEMHFVDGNWYIYVAADDINNANHRMYVLECTDPTNAQAPYVMKGKIAPTKYNETTENWDIDSAQDKWAIDGTVLQSKNGKNYFIWSGWKGDTDGQQNLYIAEMLNPWTIKGDRTLICEPDQKWERKGALENSSDILVNEGPQIIQRNGKAYIVYSACHSANDWYCLGMLTADDAALDLTQKSAWTKYTDGPLFTKSLDANDQAYGTGHASITTSPDGKEMWLIYHAFQKSGGGWPDRSARAQKISWNGDIPVFGNPVPYGKIIEGPSGSPEVKVGKYESEEAVLKGGAATIERRRASGGVAVGGVSSTASLEFTVTAPADGQYLLSVIGSSRATSGICSQIISVNGEQKKVKHSGVSIAEDIWMPCYDYTATTKGKGLVVNLKKGSNNITISGDSDSSGLAEVDYLYLTLQNEQTSIPVEGMTLDKNALNIKTSEKAQLNAIITPRNATIKGVTWSSSNPSVASVDASGLVTAKTVGTAKITVTTTDGGKTATCTVKVEAATPTPPTKITLDKNKLMLDAKKTYTLKATITGED
ncbi:MAG: putative beta-xylosidase, partial [Oscillospiraceae bacterium]|nr:putative beta-xylosidase [Oscillospiraceae bacterium]